jgi:hypothetical protein
MATGRLKGELAMYPFDTYAMARIRQEELLRQAECARLLRTVRPQLRSNWRLRQQYANWLGTQMVKWGQKLEQFGTGKELQPSSSAPRQR